MTFARRMLILAAASWLLLQPAVPCEAGGLQPAELSPVLLNVVNVSASPDDSRSPSVAARGEQVHVVWEEDGELRHRWCSGGVWSSIRRVAAGEQPSIAVSSDGTVHVVFVNEFGDNFEVYHCRWNGTSWSLPRNVSGTSGVSTAPSLALIGDSGLQVVWSDNTPGYSIIYHAEWTGRYWVNGPIPNALGGAPAATGSRDGVVYVAWQDSDQPGAPYDVFCSRFAQKSWSLPEDVSDSPSQQSLAPGIACDSLGSIHVVWEERTSGRYSVRVSWGSAGSWSIPETVSGQGDEAFLPSVTVGGAANVYVGWDESTLARYRQRSLGSGQWTAQATVASEAVGVSNLRLFTDSNGQLHGVWSQRTASGKWDVYYSRLAYRATLPLIVLRPHP